MSEYRAPIADQSAAERRKANRHIVNQYMMSAGDDRLYRHLYFCENGCCINCMTETGRPLVVQGRNALAKLAFWLKRCFPDWKWHNIRVFDGRDPDHLWVESDGRGTIQMPGYPETYCEIHYIHSFKMKCERIFIVREFPDICQKIRSLGIDFPRIGDPCVPSGETHSLLGGDGKMTSDHRTWTDPNSENIRKRNRIVVEAYMNTKGEARLRRHELFVDDGSGGLWTTDSGVPIIINGKQKLAEHAIWSLRCFPDWEWYNIKIFETDDPNHFWVECDGHGKIIFPGYPEGFYENHFLHSFELDNGKIVRNREFMNVCQQLRALGIAVPVIRRDGIPA